MNKLLIILLFLNSCTKGQSIRISASPISHVLPVIQSYLIVFAGESNSGGIAPNSAATTAEKAERSQVVIYNNGTSAFENLHVGVNNNIGHTGLQAYVNTGHGWELELANSVDSGDLQNPVYLVKTGQGGSLIADWAASGSGSSTVGTGLSYWQTFMNRVDSAKMLLTTINGGVDPAIYIFYEHGGNDALYSTNAATFKAATIAHIAKIRVRYGNVPFFMTLQPPSISALNTTLTEIAAEVADCFVIPETGCTTLADTYHWDYLSMKIMADRLIASLKTNYGR